ncbi:cyclic nucleotide-regulated ABC bacteriocin/lantibiotic exporters [Halothece sp. PCC 7418]|uniref:peptidase domain-containing ABC transporter n=1 Tax=Halothece sp. (strain PCC 7418) TaxID=65093 RepID=UPI0002A08A31|nr:peptidase domain-containing ABC transporter [Halothece sp. PCC 7418]AFZ44954.1 cyclic nucleotide-regulated ABC bacteriocin/lantibiotic exporters [Halothece sp. PCC 7418]
MSFTLTDFVSFLSEQFPFNQLPQEARERLSKKLQPLRYKMGQALALRERMPTEIQIIYKGHVRLLGYQSSNQMPITLELAGPGQTIGWVGLVRGTPCETAIASEESICLSLKVEDFWELYEQYDDFRQALQHQCSAVETFTLLCQEQDRQPHGGIDLKALTDTCLNTAVVQLLPPGNHQVANLPSDHPLKEQQRVWFVSGGGKLLNAPMGSRLDLSQENIVLTVEGKQSARLVGFQKSDLPWFNPHAQTAAEEEVIEAPEAPEIEETATVTPAVTDGVEVSEAPSVMPGTDDYEVEGETVGLKKYPHVRPRGNTALERAFACFHMLSQYFQLPFRKEVIRRVLTDQLRRTDSLSLPAAGAIAELLGLKAQLTQIPTKAIARITPPALIRWGEDLALLYDSNDREVVLGIPGEGVVTKSIKEFGEIWGEGGQILLLEATKETPQQRFGIQWFLPYINKYKGTLTLVFIASFFIQIFGLAFPLMMLVIIDKVIAQGNPDLLNVLGGFVLVIAIFEAVLTTLRTYIFVDATNRIDMTLGSKVIDHLLRLPLRYFEKRPVGELSSRVNELERIRQFLTGTALTVVLDSIFSVVYIGVMLLFSWQLTLAALSVVPLLMGVTFFFSPTIRAQLRTKAERNSQTQSYLVEVLSGIQTVKAQNIELRSRWRWQELYSRYVSAGFRNVVTSTISSSSSGFLNKLSGLIVLWFGAYLVLQGDLTLGQLIAFRIIGGKVTSPLLRLSQLWQNFQETALSLERLSDIVDNPQEGEEDRDNIPMPSIEGAVRYENISFRFKNTGPMQLNNINLDIAPGQFVGIVGQSGAGKSTLTKLVARLYEPETGRILIDNYDISKVELYSLRRQIGVVPQDPLLFEGTVQENISLTNPDASTEEIIEAAQAAVAHEFIMNLPAGYNTKVGERGAALSGGQRQRIAIARTILQRPQLLVLDEATSALDYTTEAQVSQNLAQVFQNQTVLFITHRLATIKDADLILMMDAGRIVEQGNHQELMALQGRYYYLYQQQESRV